MPFPENLPLAWIKYVESLETVAVDQTNMIRGLSFALLVTGLFAIWISVLLLRERKLEVRDPAAWTPVQYTAAGLVHILNVAMQHGPDAFRKFNDATIECGIVCVGDVMLVSSVRSPLTSGFKSDHHEHRRLMMDDVARGDGVALRVVYLNEGVSVMRLTTAEFDNWRSGRDPHAEI